MLRELEEFMVVLERTPGVVRSLVEGLPARWLDLTEPGKTWSVLDNVAHFIHGETEDWIPRTRIFLSGEDERRFVPFDPEGHVRFSRGRDIAFLLDEFERLREENCRILKELVTDKSDLERTAIHPEFGDVTLGWMLAAWVSHDLSHIAQICRIMARQYTEAVGPWKKYLPFLGA